jgi:hypothetical protein
MEKHLGRPLPRGAIVHHRNERKYDNRIENLLLMRDEDDHLSLHRAMEQGRHDLVKAHEAWAMEFMANLRNGMSLESCYPSPVQELLVRSKSALTPKVILRRTGERSG